jgi:hypothetical protein
VLLMGWIVVELAFIRSLSFFHPLYFLVGLALGSTVAGPSRYPGTVDVQVSGLRPSRKRGNA